MRSPAGQRPLLPVQRSGRAWRQGPVQGQGRAIPVFHPGGEAPLPVIDLSFPDPDHGGPEIIDAQFFEIPIDGPRTDETGRIRKALRAIAGGASRAIAGVARSIGLMGARLIERATSLGANGVEWVSLPACGMVGLVAGMALMGTLRPPGYVATGTGWRAATPLDGARLLRDHGGDAIAIAVGDDGLVTIQAAPSHQSMPPQRESR